MKWSCNVNIERQTDAGDTERLGEDPSWLSRELRMCVPGISDIGQYLLGPERPSDWVQAVQVSLSPLGTTQIWETFMRSYRVWCLNFYKAA